MRKNTLMSGALTLLRNVKVKTYIDEQLKKFSSAAMAVISLIALIMLVLICECAKPDIDYIPTNHTVTYGDTLWSIAKQYKPDNVLMQDYMLWVYEHNDNKVLIPGDIVVMAKVVQNGNEKQAVLIGDTSA